MLCIVILRITHPVVYSFLYLVTLEGEIDIKTQTEQNLKIFLLINSYIFTIPSENFISGVIVFWTLKVGLGATVIKTEIMNGKEKYTKNNK